MDTDMSPELWSRLPRNIHDRMLAFLTVPVLCRFRAVSRGHNELIRSAEFRALCRKHGSAHKYILGQVGTPQVNELGQTLQFSTSVGWRLLDVSEKRWYFIKHDPQDLYRYLEPRSMAIDGGLACAHHIDALYPGQNHVTMRLSSPLADVAARLPESPYDRTIRPPYDQGLRMPFLISVTAVEPGEDAEDARIRIFMMCRTLQLFSERPTIVVYDSATGEWESSATDLAKQTWLCARTKRLAVRSMVFFQGCVYVLISYSRKADADEPFWALWRFSPDEDNWSRVTGHKLEDVNEKSMEIKDPQLLVCGNRLFLTFWWILRGSMSFHFIEFSLEDGRWTRRKRTTEDDMRRTFGTVFESYPQQPCGVCDRHDDYAFVPPPDIAAFGLEQSIILIDRRSGVCMEVDLVEWKGRRVTFEEPRSVHAGTGPDDEVWYGQPMNLVPHHVDMFSQLRKRVDAEPIALSDSDDDSTSMDHESE